MKAVELRWMPTLARLLPQTRHGASPVSTSGKKPGSLSDLGNRSAIILGVALSFCLLNAHGAENPVVETVTPSRGDVARYVALPGTLVADQQATVYAKMPGYLNAIHVDKGDAVSTGQLLAELEMPELEADATRFSALVRVAERDYERLSSAREQAPDLVVPQMVDEALGRLETSRADLDRSRELLNYGRILAPFAGVITMRYVDPGAYIPAATSGASANTAAIVTIMDLSRLRVQIPVPERDAALVRNGQPVRLRVEGLPDRWEAVVSRISYALDPGSRTMLVEADLENPEQILRPGMYAHVEIGVETHENVLVIPSAALISERSGTSAFVVEGDRVRRISVGTGFNDGDLVEILSGLDGTETLAIPPTGGLTDGQAISRSSRP